MSNFTPQEWLAGVTERSALLKDYYTRGLDDSFGWGSMLRQMWNAPESARPSGILLTGPDGCGKHTAAGHMVDFLTGREYECLFVGEDDLDGEAENIKAGLNAALDESYDGGKALCLVFDGIKNIPSRKALYRFLGKTACEYSMTDELPPLFIIIIGEEEKELPALLRSRLQVCRVAAPDEAHRELFLNSKAADIKNYVPLKALAQQTEGFTYAGLKDLAANLAMFIDSRDGYVTAEEISAFTAQQLPEASIDELQSLMRIRLAGKTEKLVEMLPDFLADVAESVGGLKQALPQLTLQLAAGAAAAGARQGAADAVTTEEQQKTALEQEKERLENMPVKDLAAELFGEERVKALADKAEETE